MNTYYGNGLGSSKDSPSSPNSNNFGVGLVFTSNDNLVERNRIGGNANGVYLDGNGNKGNIIRRNIIVGNPSAQNSVSFGISSGADIQDMSAAGANTFQGNRCLTYVGAAVPAPCPNISEPDNDLERQEQDIAAFGRNRLAFPRATFVNAVFRRSSYEPYKPAGAGRPRRATDDSETVTVTGRVVDAACYMLHVAAATAPSHKDCSAACLARGVPLAIATDDGVLYFPADGNQRLKSLPNARVRASGTVAEKHDPMELRMPVGDKNQMVVRLEGGYKQITIQTLERIQSSRQRQ